MKNMAEWTQFAPLSKFFILLMIICQKYCRCVEFRLVDGVNRNEGFLQIVDKKGNWAVVCSQRWSKKNTRVACKMLGFSEEIFNELVNVSSIGRDTNYTTEVKARCTGKEIRFKKCPGLNVRERECRMKLAVKLGCRINVRIRYHKKGKLRVQTARGWKSLCGYQWGINNGEVICRQLGHPGVLGHPTAIPRSRQCTCNMAFNCSGKEEYIYQCPRILTNTTVCSVAAVKCKQVHAQWPHKGSIEVYHEQQWGALCDGAWNKRSANVLCKNIGYSMAVSVSRVPLNSSRRAWKLAVSCLGNESLLPLCRGWKNVLGQCNVSEESEVHVECQRRVFIIGNKDDDREGIVKLEQDKRKRSLCVERNEWTKLTADIVCRQSGFPLAVRSLVATTDEMTCRCKSVVHCNGDEESLEYCRFSTYQATTRAEQCVYAKVLCERRVRLVRSPMEANATLILSGQLQIYENHEWGVVCDHSWTIDDANVSCRELGFSLTLTNYTQKTVPGVNRVWMENVNCNGDEESLRRCTYEQDNRTSCSHNKYGVGVRCSVPGAMLCEACRCQNSSIDCSGAELKSMPWIPEDFNKDTIISLNLANNHISTLQNQDLNFPSLTDLDLSRNKFSTIPADIFANNMKLNNLKIGRNKITELPHGLLFKLSELIELDLSFNKIEIIANDTFQNNSQLQKLMLQGNRIDRITGDWSKYLKQLIHLDISRNKIIEYDWNFLSSLQNLEYLKASDYIPLCCYALELRPGVTCVAPSNAFSSCKDLLKGNALRVIIWIIISLAVAGNLCSIIIGTALKERNRVQRLLVTNLGMSDLLNGIYLLIIAAVDIRWRGNYFKHDQAWRSSFTCNLTGFISMLSSQVSVFCLTTISTIRFLSVSFPMRFGKVSLKIAFVIVIGVWTLGIMISVAPFLHNGYFKEGSLGYYERNSVCLPLQLPGPEKFKGWEYGLAIFGCLNFFLCLYLAVVYGAMFYSIGKSTANFSVGQTKEESSLLKRLFFVVLTDLCCWFPVGILIYVSLAGYVHDPDHVVYAWFAVCVMSINSAFNPLLYTFTTPKVLNTLKQTAVKACRFRWRRADENNDKQDIAVDTKDTLCFENTLTSEIGETNM